MERKHQVFVSSTYRDLIEERKEVIHALLELECIPAGMELFPATDEDAWSLIKEVIDGCDYYLLILGGKYGSTNQEGVGYTEMEFDYAIQQGKPTICFIHENIDNLPSSKVENTDSAKEKLKLFTNKAKDKHCKFWSSAADLGGKASRSLIQLKKKHPSDGWVPGKYATDPKMLSEMEKMRSVIKDLELQLLTIKNTNNNIDTTELLSGSDLYSIRLQLKNSTANELETVDIKISWDKLFSYCGPELSGECSDLKIREKIELACFHSIPEKIEKFNKHNDVVLPYVFEDQIKIQFRALGLMEPGTKKRAVSDTNTYWKLTPRGECHLIQIKALKRAGI
ncbi:DUF4062 domain-containing protein [Uliginosibacterium sp. 31-16]|uniref:DUF4062 domain-containing protein n=1 Tax=Uliginosibacterium sp. 31-16 TaxID=3068315 RepID=UPI00273E2546|nr:DUF4062 domain-containing protein [Uliginosibacterium sp. 31-16]MDP5240051.1 DUF4062 domain-containing protein [Uliginosibacterium sp. 31-16]